MTIRSVGIMSPGDMGNAIGRILRDGEFDVLTCLEERSGLTRMRASEAGIRDVPSLDDLVRQSDLVVSVLVPSEAMALAKRVADSISRTGAGPVFAEFNAIAPQTVATIGHMMMGLGVTFIDASIIGEPPQAGKRSPRFYCSGPDTSAMEPLVECGLDVRTLGPEIGQASALKMVYAASTKGTTALWTELMVAAQAFGLKDALEAEFGTSRTQVWQALISRIPSMPRRARRWIGEMEEIAATFDGLGMTPRILLGAADMYRFVGNTSLADQISREPDPVLDTMLDTLAARLAVDATGEQTR